MTKFLTVKYMGRGMNIDGVGVVGIVKGWSSKNIT